MQLLLILSLLVTLLAPPIDECLRDARAGSQDWTVLRSCTPRIDELPTIERVNPRHAEAHAAHDAIRLLTTSSILPMLHRMREDAEDALVAVLAEPQVQASIPRVSMPSTIRATEDIKHRVEEPRGNQHALRAEECRAFPDGVSASNDRFLVRDASLDLPTEMLPQSRWRIVQVQVRHGIEANGEIERPRKKMLVDVDVILDVQGRESLPGSVRERFEGDRAILRCSSWVAGTEEDDGVEARLLELRDGACSRCLTNSAGCHDREDVSHGTPKSTIRARSTVIAAELVLFANQTLTTSSSSSSSISLTLSTTKE